MFTAKSALDHLGYTADTKKYILDLYNAPHRKYHTEFHLDNMLRWVNPEYKLIRPLLESIVFHDLVYSDQAVPTGFNEAASIALFSLKKLETITDEYADLASELLVPVQAINATAYHHTDQLHLNEVSMLMLDLDMQSFAQPRDEFVRDSHFVRQEFEPFCGAKVFTKYNKKFLQMLLKRKRIYYVLHPWEERARANLEWRIKNMDAKP